MAAYDLWPDPAILFNLCQAHRHLGDLDKATFYCQSYLRNAPASTNRATTESLLEEMAHAKKTTMVPPRTEQTPVEGPRDVGVAADHPGAESAPPPRTPERQHGLSAPAQSPTDLPRPETPPERHRGADLLGWGFTASGVVGASAGAWLLLDASQLDDDAHETVDQSTRADMHERAADRRTLGAVVSAVGGAAVVIGAARLLWPGAAANSTSTALVLTPTSVSLVSSF